MRGEHEPDEIWEEWANIGGRELPRRHYLARWRLADSETAGVAVFETGPQGWAGVTAFQDDDANNLESRVRRGQRVYRRDE
jgi:hypothetical protein